jgi:hypothetical protein
VLYQIRYTQTSASPLSDKVPQELETPPTTLNTPKNVLLFPSPSLGLVFDDSILERVKMFWGVIVGESRDEEDGEDCMVFEDREGFGTDMSDDE